MTIRPSTEGRMQLERPQQTWFAGRSGDAKKLQVATFAGQEMMAIKDANDGFELRFLGFIEGPYATMDQAKSEAPKFALVVLDVIKSKVSV